VKRRSKASGKPVKTRRRKAAIPKRRNAPKSARGRAPSIADLQEQLERRTRERDEALSQQTAMADVLRVISSSPGDLKPVFDAILQNATRLCEASFGNLELSENGEFRIGATYNAPAAFAEQRLRVPLIRPHPKSGLARVVATKKFFQIDNLTEHPVYFKERFPAYVDLVEKAGARTLLIVPLLKEDELVGVFGIYRQDIRPFTEKQIALLQSFASQAVIAIENARLLNELRHRTDDLTKSLDDLRTAQDRLVQTEKLASLGQLTAGIAHEIKNPLNFVNNFSSVSVELIDELRTTLGGIHLDDKTRTEFNEIADMLQGNLDKVVQHGKRADAIVKNMLLHSRQGQASIGWSMSMLWSMRASTSPITGREPRSKASLSPWSGRSIRQPERSICSRRRSHGCCST
jgi:GAF domain-containing protein